MEHNMTIRRVISHGLLLAAVTAACLLWTVSSAYAVSITDGDLNFSTFGSGDAAYAQLRSYSGSGGEVVIPDTVRDSGIDYPVTVIGDGVFSDKKCTKNDDITAITLPAGLKEINGTAFQGCKGLTSIRIPGTVKMISYQSFDQCDKLQEVIFEAGKESLTLSSNAFANTGLTAIEIPSRAKSIGNGANIFCGSKNLAQITVETGSDSFFAEDGILYGYMDESQVLQLVAYPENRSGSQFAVPSQVNGVTVAGIARYAFSQNERLSAVTLPETLTVIDTRAFSKATGLTAVEIPGTVISIGSYAFDGCSNLNSVVLAQETAPEIGDDAFVNLKQGSQIQVKNQSVADALAPKGSMWGKIYHYTEGVTSLVVGEASKPSAQLAGALSLEAVSAEGNQAVYALYLTGASQVANLKADLSFDGERLSNGKITAAAPFSVLDQASFSTATASALFLYNVGLSPERLTSEEKVKVAEISFDIKKGAKGSAALTLTGAVLGGWTGSEDPEQTAEAVISQATASVAVGSTCDVNGDDKVDQLDITRAQRYYQMKSTDAGWETAKSCDVNGDNVIDIQDLILIYRAMLQA